MTVRKTVAALTAVAAVVAAAQPAAARQDRPPAEACAIARSIMQNQGDVQAVAAAPAKPAESERSKSARKLLGFAASALQAAAPQITARADNPLKAAAAQVAVDVVRDSAKNSAPMGGGSAAVSAKDREQGLAQAGC
ncbi:hypothetical protein [Caulobacter sp. 17J80-11]|uniref:hypothetical protein n=1 Tax=Caulobacter sp. 17J80-11 TaxID=2763502 RepID=UPI001653E066|nr:hypothetical protein [Caulobacter sp. 17J80-11]MBC6981236.1 hypothetical protein [Caulobacter sp. 17J80-11]